MIDKFEYILSRWKYSVSIDSDKKPNKDVQFDIKPKRNKPIPKFLAKYYSLKDYNVNAFISNKIYASHPNKLNDPFDCFPDLISFDSLSLEDIKIELPMLEDIIQNLDYLYNNEREYLLHFINNNVVWRLFNFNYGIISMSSALLDMKMWSYYCNHEGFQVIFKTKDISSKLRGPFPIHYMKKLIKIDFKKYRPISFLYQSNVKSINWKHEKEWRYLVYQYNMIDEDFPQPDAHDRLFDINPDSIDKVVFGYKFF